METTKKADYSSLTNRDLLLPYFAPYFAYVGIAALFQNIMPIEVNYCLRLIAVPALLYWAWRWYVPLTGPNSPFISILYGLVAGVLGFGLWIVFYAPFAEPDTTAWSSSGFYLRFISASLVVPVFEEIAMRGYVFRFALQWDQIRKNKLRKDKAIKDKTGKHQNRKKMLKGSFVKVLDESNISDVRAGSWTVWAVLISSIVFALGHTVQQWPAAIAYGILMSVLWILRKDLLTCIIAHGTTNLTLALYVYFTGHWELW
ncbi:MAG: CPBP family glutamic-type intramembrane protease [Desulfobacula sp.]|jgi:membrane protease YdiL (CAAX protease family)|nr:CPBP family glutamic-type intramembrane protease [Desulfobacula sp.]